MEIVNKNILYETKWRKGVLYILEGNIRVYSRLEIEDSVEIGFSQGSRLIFSEGSKLEAGNIFAYQVDKNYNKMNTAIDGGFVFMELINKKFSINNVPILFEELEKHYLRNL